MSALPPPPPGSLPPYWQPPVVVQVQQPNNSSLAPVTSVVCGSLAFGLSWLPIIGIVGWFFGSAGLLFGIIGLRRGGPEHKVLSWLGIVGSAIGLVVCLIWLVIILTAVGQSG